MNLINICYGTIKAKSSTEIIEEGKKNHSLMSDEEYEEMTVEFKKIADTFLEEDREHNSVATIIDRYRNTLWNDFHVQTIIDVACREGDNINSTDMKEKIEQIVLGIKSVSVSYYEVLILALLVKVMSLNISILDIEKIMGINVAFDSKFTNDKNVLEILNFSEECTDFRIKSAVTARMILQELNCNDVIIKVLGKTANYTNKYRSIERYENVLKNIISYSHVSTFLVKSSQREEFLVKYYDSLKELEYYSENTFFWLQYAIACANIGFYDLAQRFLDTAYEYFRESEYTVPFQADTQQARLYLLRIENEQRTDNTELFEKAHRLLMRPAVSSKDNEEKKIQLMKKYVDTHIRRKVQMKDSTVYQVCCGEAYNMVHEFLKKPMASRNGNDYTKLEKSLLKAAASESKI